MAIHRLWFPETPGADQRSQVAVGYTLVYVVPPIPVILPDVNLAYYRNYLNDVLSINTVGPQTVSAVEPETSLTTYLRRYLNDLKI